MPAEVEPDGLQDALEMLARNTVELHHTHCRVDCPQPVVLPSGPTASHLYRIAQEAVQNALRHADATEILIESKGDETLLLRVCDDGRGMSNLDPDSGMGLRIMRYRSTLIGGDLRIDTQPGAGTTVTCTVPLRK